LIGITGFELPSPNGFLDDRGPLVAVGFAGPVSFLHPSHALTGDSLNCGDYSGGLWMPGHDASE
jgi:hypothetical protein